MGGTGGSTTAGNAAGRCGRGGEVGAGAEAGASGAGPLLCDTGELPPLASLVHRYAFDGTGTLISDSIGTAHGKLIATDASALDGNGTLELKGGLSYVDLPNGLISPLTNTTLMAWFSWPQGGAAFQRIFDFGETTEVRWVKTRPGKRRATTSACRTWPPRR